MFNSRAHKKDKRLRKETTTSENKLFRMSQGRERSNKASVRRRGNQNVGILCSEARGNVPKSSGILQLLLDIKSSLLIFVCN